MHIGLLGATGPAGSAVATRLAGVGHAVVIGSRSKYRAMEVRDGIVDTRHETRVAARFTGDGLPRREPGHGAG